MSSFFSSQNHWIKTACACVWFTFQFIYNIGNYYEAIIDTMFYSVSRFDCHQMKCEKDMENKKKMNEPSIETANFADTAFRNTFVFHSISI